MNVTLILNLTSFVIINFPSYGDSKIVYSASATKEDVDSLVPINPGEELPLILFEEEYSTQIRYPKTLISVQIEDGRIYSDETLFYATESSRFNQFFLCPHRNQCLVVNWFKESQALQCDFEFKPSFIKVTPSFHLPGCGSETDGTLYSFGYEFCKHPGSMVSIYSVCHNGADEEIVFVQYPLVSAKLLDENLLIQEQAMDYDQDEVISSAKIHFPIVQEKLNRDSEMKLIYKLRYLVPPENMAFAAWKKATYHYVNQALQHKDLIDLWDEINSYIRQDAIKMFTVDRQISTGVMKIPENRITTAQEENFIYNIWITVIVELTTHMPRTLVILMNNFITKTNPSDTDEQTADASKSNLQFIDELCGDEGSFCEQKLNQKFTQIKGEVRCCKLNYRIKAHFNINTIFRLNLTSEILKIKNLTTA